MPTHLYATAPALRLKGPWALLLALLSFAFCAVGNAGGKPLTDVAIDDTNVDPESMSAAHDGTLYIGSMKGIVFRAPPGSPKAEPWIRPTQENGILSILGVLT